MQYMRHLVESQEEVFSEGSGAFRLTWLETIEAERSNETMDSQHLSIELETVEVHQTLSYSNTAERVSYLQFIDDVGARERLISESAKTANEDQPWTRGHVLELRHSLESGRPVVEIADLLRRREDEIRDKAIVLGLTHLLK